MQTPCSKCPGPLQSFSFIKKYSRQSFINYSCLFSEPSPIIPYHSYHLTNISQLISFLLTQGYRSHCIKIGSAKGVGKSPCTKATLQKQCPRELVLLCETKAGGSCRGDIVVTAALMVGNNAAGLVIDGNGRRTRFQCSELLHRPATRAQACAGAKSNWPCAFAASSIRACCVGSMDLLDSTKDRRPATQ